MFPKKNDIISHCNRLLLCHNNYCWHRKGGGVAEWFRHWTPVREVKVSNRGSGINLLLLPFSLRAQCLDFPVRRTTKVQSATGESTLNTPRQRQKKLSWHISVHIPPGTMTCDNTKTAYRWRQVLLQNGPLFPNCSTGWTGGNPKVMSQVLSVGFNENDNGQHLY